MKTTAWLVSTPISSMAKTRSASGKRPCARLPSEPSPKAPRRSRSQVVTPKPSSPTKGCPAPVPLPSSNGERSPSKSRLPRDFEAPNVELLSFISYNVCSLRSLLKTDVLQKLADDYKPDVLALQETKMTADAVEKLSGDVLKGYDVYWHHSLTAKGHHGVATFVQKREGLRVLNVEQGMKLDELSDGEGRLLTVRLESDKHGDISFVNAYVPNSGMRLARLEYRTTVFETAVRQYLSSLRDGKSMVLYAGDLNVAHEEIDIHDSKGNRRNAGHTIEERGEFSKLLSEGWIDCFRALHPDVISYTYWSRRRGDSAKVQNKGWRLDYFCIPKHSLDRVESVSHLSEISGSDHAPILLTLKPKPDS